jgi:hypothetical protein
MHLADASTAVTGADARFEFSCFVATCTGTTELTIVETEHYRVKGHLRTRSVRVDLGSAKYHIAAWAKGRVLVRLSSGARTMLARSSHHRLVVTLRLTLKGGPTKNFRVVLT